MRNIYNRPLGLLLSFILLTTASSYAQQTIRGNVKAAETNETLPGVNIVVKGTIHGTTTDLDGNYAIEIQQNEKVLIFSFTGYETFEAEIGTQQTINVSLREATELLDEIVVIGYGTVRKSDLTGAVSSIKADDIRKTTSSNATQALQGRATGVHITTTSGAPGASASVRVRGVGTFNNSAPIYVVDGVILEDISFLNPGDISSMEVLKDASATAIYGSRGANGVILVQTKRGEAGIDRPAINFSSEYGIQQLSRKIDLLSGREFAVISNEIRPGSYNNVDAVPNTDWQDLVFRTAPIQNHQLSIAGASTKSTYYVGIGLYQQDGIIPKSYYQRLTLQLNNTYELNSKINIGNNLTIAPYKQRNAPNVTYSIYRAQPVLVPYYDDGSFGVVHNVGNPMADLEYSNSYNNGLRAVGSLFAEAKLHQNLKFRSSFGIDAGMNKAVSFTPAYTVYNPDGTASQQDNEFSNLFKGNSESLSWLWENTLTFTQSFQQHNIDAVGGYTMQQARSELMGMSGRNILRDESDFWYLHPAYIMDEANNINMLQSLYNGVDAGLYYSMISFLFRANYTYNNRYIATITFRRDGSSKFSDENRYSNFPSFAVGWNIANEDFMRNVFLITALKLRASWGKIGNEKITYFDRFARVQSGLLAVFSNPDATYPAASYGKSGNPNLIWETTSQTDIGLEIGLFNNKLTAEFDYYHRITDDILIELSTPGHLGNGQGQKVRYNAAQVLNSGFEFLFKWREVRKDLSYSIALLGSTIHNEVLEIGGNTGIDSLLIGGYLANGQPVTRSMVGLPIGAFYGYVTDGIFQSQEELGAYPHLAAAGVGDLRFVDINNDGKLDGSDRTLIGSPIPKFIFGINLEFQYKAYDLAIDFQGQTGNKIFNGKDVVRPDPYNFESYVWDRWTGQGTSNDVPKPSFGGYNFTPSDFFIQDGSFIRLRNLIVGYTLPQGLTNRIKLQQVRFYLKGSNLFTFTKFKGYTPEIGSHDVLSNGIDYGVYPIAAVYSIGLNVNF